jgi:protein-L-isoaspartate(D-aspartate) O-methyltransferase
MPLIFRRARFLALVACVLCAACLPFASARDPFDAARDHMVDEYIVAEGVKNPRVLAAMRRTPRHEFMPAEIRPKAYWDMSLPIGYGQTISPPYIVAYMTEQLDPQKDDKVLEIGTGSGYQAAVLSEIVKEVYTIEIVDALGKRATGTLKRLKYDNVHTRIGDGFKGWPEKAPFDKIIVTCSPEDVPKPLVEQLKEGGRMVIPLGERYQQTLWLYTKKDGQLVREALAPTMFVPMTGHAEAGRKVKPDAANPAIVNGSFEDIDEKSGRVNNWYYQRQMTVDTTDPRDGKRYVTFSNREAGRLAQVLQAFPVDGRQVKNLAIACWVKGSAIRSGRQAHENAAMLVTFYDKDRKTLDDVPLRNWRDTFDWEEFDTRLKVPPTAREAILRLGLHGATGSISFDGVTVQAAK